MILKANEISSQEKVKDARESLKVDDVVEAKPEGLAAIVAERKAPIGQGDVHTQAPVERDSCWCRRLAHGEDIWR